MERMITETELFDCLQLGQGSYWYLNITNDFINISHKVLHFQIIGNFVVTFHWLLRNINKSLNFIHIQINNV